MRKTILFLALLMIGAGAFAQNGALTINNNSSCDVYINLFGYDAASLNVAPCAISTWLIIVPAATSQSWASVVAFNTLPNPGFASEIFPVPPGFGQVPQLLNGQMHNTNIIAPYRIAQAGMRLPILVLWQLVEECYPLVLDTVVLLELGQGHCHVPF